MNLIDTNCVEYIFQTEKQCTEDYFMSPDILDEVALTQAGNNKSLPKKIHSIVGCHLFDEGVYIDFYKQMLNKHNGKSFFNMTGFGDISILATTHTIINVLNKQKQHSLFDDTDRPVIIFTEDKGLQKRISKEFLDENVICKRYAEIK